MNLPDIAAASAGVWERLAGRLVSTATSGHSSARLDQWQAALAAADQPDPAARLTKRLAWDGLSRESVSPALGDSRWNDSEPLPNWAALLPLVSQAACELGASAPVTQRALKADQPIQFEELLLPFVLVAAKQLQICTDAYDCFGPTAHSDLERGLLAQLCRLALPTLQFSFSVYRALHPPVPDDPPRARYNAFAGSLLADGLDNILADYVALARLLAQATQFWIDSNCELIDRFKADWPNLQTEFSLPSGAPAGPAVVGVEVALSDPHRNGRTVAILTLAGGGKLVYKPRSLGLDLAFSKLLTWINSFDDLLPLRPIAVLDCGTHGWMEYIDYRSCQTGAEAQRYYERAGQLLCLAYLLQGADIHAENIIAGGEHPTLIDLEMIFQANPRHLLEQPGLGLDAGQSALHQRVLTSVGRTLLLPVWMLGPDGRAFDVSGLGDVSETKSIFKSARWQNVNSDSMSLEKDYALRKLGHNAPKLKDQPLNPDDYLAELTAGFERMYHWLIRRRADVPLHWFAGQQARFLMRGTQLYFQVLNKVLSPRHLHSGLDRSIQLDVLTRQFLSLDEISTAWPIVRAEINALFQGDIPYFSYAINSADLPVGGAVIEDFFEKSGYQMVTERLAELGEDDLAFQLNLIRGAMYTRVAAAPKPGAAIEPGSARLLSNDELIQGAVAIADDLERHALWSGQSVGWLGYNLIQSAGRYQLQPLDSDLYGGKTGVALFLAALEKVAGGGGRCRTLALAALGDLKQALAESRPDHFLYARIGGGDGVGSTVYGLLRAGEFLGEQDLIDAARQLARFVTPAGIKNDKEFDPISGSAGAILCLLALHAATGDGYSLDMAAACGQHLLDTRVPSEQGLRAWPTLANFVPAGKLPTGMAHGAAGIAYSLVRLALATGDSSFKDAAAEAIAYEAAEFVPEQGNWPDYRMKRADGTYGFMTSWCHGAPGVALARLGGLAGLDTPAIRNDIDAGLDTTAPAGAANVDHCCCGTLGRAEVMLVASARLGRPELAGRARQLASWAVEQSRALSGYQLFHDLPRGVYHPGFHHGTAGIGYQLLRLAFPNRLPSILLWE